MYCNDDLIAEYRLIELDSILRLVEDSIEDAIEAQQIKDDCDESTYMIYTSGKCLVTVREIMVLCSNGLPDGALALARNLYEQMIITAYIEQTEDLDERKEILEKYNADYLVKQLNGRKAIDELQGKKKKVDEACKERRELLSQYGVKKHSDYWWAPNKGSFVDIALSVINNENNEDIRQLLITAHGLYKRACLTLHASSMGNKIRLGSTNQAVDLGPWTEGQEYALYLAAVSLLQVFGYTSLHLRFPKEDCLEINKTLNELALYYDSVAKKNQIKSNLKEHLEETVDE